MKRLLLVLLPLLLGCGGKAADRPYKIGFMPKLTGIPYFTACEKGAREAAAELGLELDYNGPNAAVVGPQIDMLNQWISSGYYDCVAVACNDPDQIAPALKRARQRGLPVVTYDADSKEDARDFFVNQATYDDVAQEMVDALAEELEPRGIGKVAILTSDINAPNQSQWARRIKEYVKKKYPHMELLAEIEHAEDRDLGIRKAKALLQKEQDIKGIIGLTSVAVPAAAEAVRQEGKVGRVKVSGVSTPKDMRDYLLDGTVKTVVLWSPVDLGYLTVHVADHLRKKEMPENGTITAGRLGSVTVRNREVLLGKPIRITKDNIDRLGF